MVSRGVLFLWLSLHGLIAVAGGRLETQADKTSLMLGESLIYKVTAENAGAPLSEIRLDKLKAQFEIYGQSFAAEEKVIRGRKIVRETLTLILYPRVAGRLRVPVLDFQGLRTRAQFIQVSGNGTKIRFNTRLDVSEPMVREELALTLELIDEGNMQWTVGKQLHVPGMYQRWVSETQEELFQGGNRYTVHRYIWAIMPLIEGKMKIDFPVLEAFRLGARLRFNIPSHVLKAEALPSYLPVQVPVGRPEISMMQIPAEMELNRPFNLELVFRGSGLNADSLKKWLANLEFPHQLKVYPADISLNESVHKVSVQQEWRMTIPVMATDTGKLPLPEWRFPYYSKEIGRLEDVSLPAQVLSVFNPALRSLLKVMFLFLVAGAVSWSGTLMYQKITRCRRKKNRLRNLRQVSTPQALREVILAFGAGESGLTLHSWLEAASIQCGEPELLRASVMKLEAMLYGPAGSNSDISKLVAEFELQLGKLTC